MKRLATSLTLLAALPLASLAWTAEKPEVLDVWPGKAPGETKAIGEEKMEDSKNVKRIANVSKPTLTIYRPAKDKDTGAAVVVCPGGGYNILAWDLEGTEVAEWLNSIGTTGIVLKYRVPRRPDQPQNKPPLGALQDAQRALSLVRSKAKEWHLDPKRIGILGFSAGGHLAAWASTNFDKRAYETADDIDKVDCRPDFAVLVYPGGVVPRGKQELSEEIRVRKECPPMFFAHAGNDGVTPENSVRMYLALKRAGVPAELHIYAKGGHGFGLRPSQNPCSTWPKSCEAWLRSQGLLKGDKAAKAPAATTDKDRLERIRELKVRIGVTESDVNMWIERAEWSDRMSRPGRQYVTLAQVESDRARLRTAKLQMKQLRRELEALESEPVKPLPSNSKK